MDCGLNVPFFRQALLLLAACLTSFTVGIIAAFPSVLNPAILATDADIKATADQASWITACFGLSAIPALAVIPSIFEMFGRNITNVITNVVLLIGCVIQYIANDVYSLAFSRLCQGISMPGLDTFVFALSECTSSERRGYFMVLNKISVGLGVVTCHALGFVLNWRQIAILSAIPACLSIILSMFVSESPSFFAFHGKFDKSVKAFEWYRGDSLKAKQELKELVAAQTENFRMKQREMSTSTFKKIKYMLLTKDFRKSFFIVILAKLCLDLSGRQFMIVYISQILVEITNNQTLAMYLSIVSDVVIISALCISCLLVKRFKRRALLFKLGFCSAFLMLIVSLSLILGHRLNLIHHIKWLTPSILSLHLFIAHVGLIPLAFTLSGEVFSLEHRGIGLFITGVISLSFYTLTLKIIPMMIDNLGVEGVFSIFGLLLLICLILLRIILIETKDKTLQQIENELKETVRDESKTEILGYCKVSNSNS